jgi:hypothetical protein
LIVCFSPDNLVIAEVSNNPQFVPTIPEIPFKDHLDIVDLVGPCARQVLVDAATHYQDALFSPPGKLCWRLFAVGEHRPHPNDEKTTVDLAAAFNVDPVGLDANLRHIVDNPDLSTG